VEVGILRKPEKILIVGGGIGGMCAAIELRKRQIPVDLVEIDPQWRVYGAGITINAATLRAFRQIGVLPEILEHGSASDGLDMLLADGTHIGTIAGRPVEGSDISATAGILRPALTRILSAATRAAGTNVRLGTTLRSIQHEAEHAEVAFSDGSSGRYDLVIGADGINSQLRQLIFPDAPAPRFTGQACWRAVVPRPPEIKRAAMFLGRQVKAGINPVSKEEMYLFFLDRRDTPDHIDAQHWPAILRTSLAEFVGPVAAIRDSLTTQSHIIYRPLFALLVPPPWHRNSVVLIGDAAHATTPHLASGAGLAVEDSLVLAEELERAPTVKSALERFTARRYERCRLVVENSVRLGDIERIGGSAAEHEQLMRSSMAALAAAI
jgi:2-polyprenyl-6-methoxyphenol hydroxylase-like FAD-dependent oxidoreductase